MTNRERKLIRKQINFKLKSFANKESKENDFINSSQMITQRQQMYMTISKHFRAKDNERKPKKLPFDIEKTSLPHVNLAVLNRLYEATNDTLKSPTLDKIVSAHSFRTATPFYTNPELNVDRGKMMNYTVHLGAILHTPRYIDFIKKTPAYITATKNQQQQKDEQQFQYSDIESRSSSSTISVLMDPNNEYILQKSSSSNQSLTSRRSSKGTDTLDKNNSSLSNSSRNKNKKEINISLRNEYIYSEDTIKNSISNESGRRSKRSNYAENSLSNYWDEAMTNGEMRICDDIFIEIENRECVSSNSSKRYSDENSSNKELKKKSEISQKKETGKEKDKRKSKNSRITVPDPENDTFNVNEIKEKEKEPNENFPELNEGENESISSLQDYKQNVKNRFILQEIEAFFQNKELEKKEFDLINRYFETIDKYRFRRPDYVQEYGNHLLKYHYEPFNEFHRMVVSYDTNNITEEDCKSIKEIIKKYELKTEFSNNLTFKRPYQKLDISYETKTEKSFNEVELEKMVSSPGENDTSREILELEEHDKEISDLVDAVLNKVLSEEKNIRTKEETVHENEENEEDNIDNEDFAECFRNLFRNSITKLNKDDIVDLNKLVNQYKDFYDNFRELYMTEKESISSDDRKNLIKLLNNNLEENEEGYNKNITEFKKLMNKYNRNISDSDLEKIKELLNEENGVEKCSESAIEEEETEMMLAFRTLFRSSIGDIKETDLEKIQMIIKDYEEEKV